MVWYLENIDSCCVKNSLHMIKFNLFTMHSNCSINPHVVLKKRMELVDKPGCKLAVWKQFGLNYDEEKHPVIDRQMFGKVAACNSNKFNLIAHLQNNHPTNYTNFAKQNVWKGKQDQSNKSTFQQKSITEVLVSTKHTIKKATSVWSLLTHVAYCIAKDMLPMYSIEKQSFRSMFATFNKR